MSTTTEQTGAPIMVRAKITRAEWEAFRILAIKLNVSTSELVGIQMRNLLEEQDDAA